MIRAVLFYQHVEKLETGFVLQELLVVSSCPESPRKLILTSAQPWMFVARSALGFLLVCNDFYICQTRLLNMCYSHLAGY